MLPRSLLRVRRRRDSISPIYAESNVATLEITKTIIDLYSESLGKKKGLLNTAVSQLENIGYDFRFIRGLATLLDRRCNLIETSQVPPLDVRRKLFKLTSEKGVPKSIEERSTLLSQIAKELKITIEILEKSFYGDLEDEMTINSFNPIAPVELIKQYNLSLTQTLLFNAAELSFTASGNWQDLFRQIKWLGLIYSVSTRGSKYWVTLDGPISLFKLTKRYGTALAKLLPGIFNNEYWEVNAKVVDRARQGKLLNFELNSLSHHKYFSKVDRVEKFDSKIEEDFACRFRSVVKDWDLVREPDPLPVGTHVMIPDFLLKKGNLTVYLEIAGFWTPQYLEEKVRKLEFIRDLDMIVAVDKRLACHKFQKKNNSINLIFYKRKIPLKPILNHLQKKEQCLTEVESKFLLNTELNFNTPIVEPKEIATQSGVSLDTVKKMMTQLQIGGYRRLPGIFVKEAALKVIKEKLKKRLLTHKLSFVEASKIIESCGGKHPSTIIEALGYTIIWYGINPESTEIR